MQAGKIIDSYYFGFDKAEFPFVFSRLCVRNVKHSSISSPKNIVEIRVPLDLGGFSIETLLASH